MNKNEQDNIRAKTGERIRRVLEEKGLSQAELAKRMGKAVTTISTTISKGNPTITTLHDIADAIGVPASTLLVERSDEEPLTALVRHAGEYYHARTLTELEYVVETIRELADSSD